MLVEDYMFLLKYETRGGGRPSEAARDHLKFQVDGILLAHVKPSAQARSTFTCNTSVTVDDVYGSGTIAAGAAPPSALAVMTGLSYEGAGIDIPTRAITFLINRCASITITIKLGTFVGYAPTLKNKGSYFSY